MGVHGCATRVHYQISRNLYGAHLVPVVDHARPTGQLASETNRHRVVHPLTPSRRDAKHRQAKMPSASSRSSSCGVAGSRFAPLSLGCLTTSGNRMHVEHAISPVWFCRAGRGISAIPTMVLGFPLIRSRPESRYRDAARCDAVPAALRFISFVHFFLSVRFHHIAYPVITSTTGTKPSSAHAICRIRPPKSPKWTE